MFSSHCKTIHPPPLKRMATSTPLLSVVELSARRRVVRLPFVCRKIEQSFTFNFPHHSQNNNNNQPTNLPDCNLLPHVPCPPTILVVVVLVYDHHFVVAIVVAGSRLRSDNKIATLAARALPCPGSCVQILVCRQDTTTGMLCMVAAVVCVCNVHCP